MQHSPDFVSYDFKCPVIGGLPFLRGINVIICSAIEQAMTDEEFDRYSRDFAVCVPTIGRSNARFEELVFG